jgi:hypothetical protein
MNNISTTKISNKFVPRTHSHTKSRIKNIVNKLKHKKITKKTAKKSSITNTKFKKMLEKWKKINDNVEDMYSINDVCHHIRSNFFKKRLKLELPVPTIAFVNIQNQKKMNGLKTLIILHD